MTATETALTDLVTFFRDNYEVCELTDVDGSGRLAELLESAEEVLKYGD